MCRGFNRSDLTTFASRGHGKPSFNRGPLEIRVHLEIAKKSLLDRVLSVKALEIRTWPQPNLWHEARELWCTFRLSRHRAGDGINHNIFGSRVVLRGVSVSDAQHVPS